MADIAVIAKLTAQEGKRDDLAAALQTALATAQDEPGTLAYILLQDLADANVLWFYEMYTDQSALDAHMGSDAFKALGPAIGPFLGGRPELIMCKPLGGKGV
ncbi:MAG: antibiotic biosynthesis monooxygenase [Acidimicrobiales bacterium]|nr:antibiotic biosynthesis monooxygenase [Acidimicrobiales bacterium]MCB9394099.1 antibiotic biosynthesis monooxygenase [Acidimicrobiaceae bacterium]